MARPFDPATVPARRVLLQAQIIHGALCAGLFSFGVVAFFIGGSDSVDTQLPEETLRLLPLVAGGLTALTALPAMLLTGRFAARNLSDEHFDPGLRAQRYLFSRIICAAMIEGPGLFWGVISFLSGDPLHLAGLGFCLFALLSTLPRAAEWEDAGFDLDRSLTGERLDEV